MNQDEWNKICEYTCRSAGERMKIRSTPFLVSHEVYLEGKKSGWITENDQFDWEKIKDESQE